MDEDLGPAMQRLDSRRRAYVRAYLEHPTLPQKELARLAGYSDRATDNNYLSMQGHRVLHAKKVIEAINEELDRAFRGDAAVGRHVVRRIALDDKNPHQLKAALALLDRGGFQVESIQKITVEKHDLTGKALIERIKTLADKHGLDVQKLIGKNNLPSDPDPGAIEGEFKHVEERTQDAGTGAALSSPGSIGTGSDRSVHTEGQEE